MQKLHLHPNYGHLEESIRAILENFSNQGELLAGGERNSIKVFEVDNLKLNIKQFKTPNLLNAFIYKYIRKSKARRSYEYAERLISKGIKTPLPIAYMESSSFLGLGESFYISEHLDYDFDFRVLIHKPQFPNRNEILEQFTAFTYLLHENNVEFLDHSPGNTLIVDKGNNAYDFYLIDLNRMRFKTLTFIDRIHNFRRLWLSKAMIKIMARTYADLSNRSYEETHEAMLASSRKFQRVKNSKKLRRLGRRPRFKS